jgi:hypothetical protein
MMTSGPAARIGDVMDVPFPRPRSRADLAESAEYDSLRERLFSFLEDQSPEGSCPPR